MAADTAESHIEQLIADKHAMLREHDEYVTRMLSAEQLAANSAQAVRVHPNSRIGRKTTHPHQPRPSCSVPVHPSAPSL